MKQDKGRFIKLSALLLVLSQFAACGAEIELVNQTPVALEMTIAVDEDAPQIITLSGQDRDGSIADYTIESNPAHGSLSGTTPNLTYTPATNYNGIDSFTFTVTDNESATSTAATVSITVHAVNDLPVAMMQNVTSDEDSATGITLAGNDIDGSISGYTVVTSPAHGVLGGSAPNLTYTPAASYNGNDSFTFTVTDDAGATSSAATVFIIVNGVNDAPVAAAQNVITDEDSATGITLAGSDIDGNISGYTVVTSPAHGVLSGTAPNLSYTPDTDYFGSDSFTFTVTDNTGATSSAATVSIMVNGVNDPPVAAAQNITVDEDSTTGITLAGSDLDGTIGSYSVGTPAHGVLSGTAPNVSYTPDTDYFGSDSFTFTVTDNAGSTSSAATVSITVNAVNDSPSFVKGVDQAVNEDVAAQTVIRWATGISTGPVNESGQVVSFLVSNDNNALFSEQPAVSGDGTLSYTPAVDVFGSTTVSLQIQDDGGTVHGGVDTSTTQTFTISIGAVNDAPTAAADGFSATGNTQKHFAAPGVMANDSDIDSPAVDLTVTAGLITTANGGSVDMNSNGSFVYTPPVGVKSDSFNYSLNDNDATNPQSSVGTVSITMSGMVWYVDESAGAGNGTSAAPFNTLVAGAAAASSAETIFVYTGSYSGGITLATAGQFIGEGEGLSVDGLTIAAGTPPTITGSGGAAANTISLANGNTIKGITITGDARGIRGENITGLAVQNVTFSNTGGDSISLFDSDGEVNLRDTSFSNNSFAVDGLDIDNFSLTTGTLTLVVDNADFTGNTTATGMLNAIDVQSSTTSTIDVTITGSSFTNTYTDGIEIDVNGTGGGDSVTIGASANRNSYTGIGVLPMDLRAGNNSSVSFDIRGNDIDGNGLSTRHGIEILSGDAFTATVNINDNTLTRIGDSATDNTIRLFVGNTPAANARMDLTVGNNTLLNNTATGLLVDVFGGSDANVTVDNNSFGSNGNAEGMKVLTDISGTQVCLAASGNSFAGGDRVNLTETNGDLRVPATASEAVLSNNNGGAVIVTSGPVGYGENCTIP